MSFFFRNQPLPCAIFCRFSLFATEGRELLSPSEDFDRPTGRLDAPGFQQLRDPAPFQNPFGRFRPLVGVLSYLLAVRKSPETSFSQKSMRFLQTHCFSVAIFHFPWGKTQTAIFWRSANLHVMFPLVPAQELKKADPQIWDTLKPIILNAHLQDHMECANHVDADGKCKSCFFAWGPCHHGNSMHGLFLIWKGRAGHA